MDFIPAPPGSAYDKVETSRSSRTNFEPNWDYLMCVESGKDSHSLSKMKYSLMIHRWLRYIDPFPRKVWKIAQSLGLPSYPNFDHPPLTCSEAKEPQRKVNLMLWKSLGESYDHQTRSLVWANLRGIRYAYSLCSRRPVISSIVIIFNDGRDGVSTSATNPAYHSIVLARSIGV